MFEEFKKWLRGFHTENVVLKYVSYVKEIFKYFGLMEPIDKATCHEYIHKLSIAIDEINNGKAISNIILSDIASSHAKESHLSDLRSGMWAYYDFLISGDDGVPSSKIEDDMEYAPKVISPKKEEKSSTYKKPKLSIPRGFDHDTKFVKYAEDVPDDKKVPGLCVELENQLERIIHYAHHTFPMFGMDYRMIPVILKQECPHEDYPLSKDEIAEIIYNKSKKQGFSKKTIKKYLETCVALGITGKYHSRSEKHEPYIEIFFENFNAEYFEQYLALVIQTLAHEFFHHIHHVVKRTEKDNIKVSESLADFFSTLYLLHEVDERTLAKHLINEMENAADNRYQFWLTYVNTSIPYAYAIYYMYDSLDIENANNYLCETYQNFLDNGYINKFIHVLEVSITDPEQAFEYLTA